MAVGYKTEFEEVWFKKNTFPVNIALPPRMKIFVKTGLSVEIPKDTVLLIYPRSGLAAKSGVTLANCVGVIDSDYRGEIMIPLYNQSNKTYVVKNGERVAQGIIHQLPAIEIIEAEELAQTERNDGGFGSTGSN